MGLFKHRRAANRTPEYRARMSRLMKAMWEARKKQGTPYFPRGLSEREREEHIAARGYERHDAEPL